MTATAWSLIDQSVGTWQLLERDGELYLQARYSVGFSIDTSLLMLLTAEECAELDLGGYDYLDGLARQVQVNGYPIGDEPSFYHDRDLYKGPDGERLREEVRAAVEGRDLA